MHTWQLQQARSRFSEVVDCTLNEGPQVVTRRGEEVVVLLSVRDYRQVKRQLKSTSSLTNILLNAPRGEPLKLERSSELIRDIAL